MNSICYKNPIFNKVLRTLKKRMKNNKKGKG